MARIDQYFKQLIQNIKEYGFNYVDETRGVECKQINAAGLQINMEEFPVLTIKGMYWKGIVTELLWFLKGNTNIRYLRERGVHIWDKDAYQYYCRNCVEIGVDPMDKESFLSMIDAREEGPLSATIQGSEESKQFTFGDVGENYGSQWRDFNGVDQIEKLFTNLRNRPINRRNIVTAWNPAADTALPACHWAWEILPRPMFAYERLAIYNQNNAQQSEEEDAETIHKMCDKAGIANTCFDLKWHQRSVDTFLGLPFNIASYALLGTFIETFTGMVFRTLIMDLSCIHIYGNHLDAVEELMQRDPNKYEAPKLSASSKVIELREQFIKGEIGISEVINQLDENDFQLTDYESYPVIKAEMLAPKV